MCKNLKITILLFLSLLILSCSKDDGPKKEYYPTKITTTFPSSSSSNATMNISYDNKNRISQFKYEKSAETNTFEVSYNSDNLVSTIIRTKSNGSSTTSFTLNYSYTNKNLSQINLISSSTNEITNVAYVESSNTFILTDSTSDVITFKYDTNNNIKQISLNTTGSTSNFTFNNNTGIYNIKNNSFPLLYASIISDFYDTYNYSWFFSTKEVTEFTLGAKGSIVTEVTRDDKNNITQIDQKDGFTDEIYSTSSIDYILR